MGIQLENVNENSIWKFKWKFNLEMEIKFYLEIGKKVYENNENWEITKIKEFQLENGIEESQKWKKKWFVRLRDELTVKNTVQK